LSRVQRKLHARFLGEHGAVMHCAYPTTFFNVD
jgi:hypothetical protein